MNNQEIPDQDTVVESTPDETVFTESSFGDEVKLEPKNEDSVMSVSVEEDQEVKRQTSTSNDDYEIVSANSKRTSLGSDEKDKTPTPPEIQVPPPTTVTVNLPEPESPASTVKFNEEDAEAGTVQPVVEGIWSRILKWIRSFVDWFRWVLGQ